MINRSIITPDSSEDLSFINTSYNLSTSIEFHNKETYLNTIKNITFVPRSGTHNNFIKKEEVILYVINGELSYSDSLNNNLLLKKGNMIYINGGDGLSYDIFNNGIDYLDIIEISTCINMDQPSISSSSLNYMTPFIVPSSLNNEPENFLKYRVSSKKGLAPIKSFCDINIYSLTLKENEQIDFEVKKDRTAFLLQGYGLSLMKADITNLEFDLKGSDGLKICSESFTLSSELTSDFILVECPSF